MTSDETPNINKPVDNSITPKETPSKESGASITTKERVYRQKPTARQKAFELKLKQAIIDPVGFAEKEGKLTLKNIAKRVGYSDETADNTHKIRRKESFALTVAEEVDILNKLIKDAYEVMAKEKEAGTVRYQDATQGLERLMKQKQLLTGQATENIAFKIVE